MRKLKFRAWSNEEKKFFSVKSLPIDWSVWSTRGAWIQTLDGEELIETKNENNYVIQQSTGLLDKNDVEIYEGDITKDLDSECGVVKFEHGCFLIVSKNMVLPFWFVISDLNGLVTPRRMDSTAFEVVGNIFENKELIT